MIVGIGIGIPVGVVGCIAVAIWWLMKQFEDE